MKQVYYNYLSLFLEPDQPFFETIARIRQAVGGPEEEISKCSI